MTHQTIHDDHCRETQRPSSPRAAIAFSALPVVTWLREKAVGLARLAKFARIKFGQTTAKRITTGRQKPWAKTQDITLEVQSID
jgi:hypothetical protein